MNCTQSLMNKLGTYERVEASTYIPVIGSVSSLLITGLAVKTIWNDRNHDAKTLSSSDHAKLAIYNIVNIASLGLVGTSFGIVKLVACFFSSLSSCCCGVQSDVESKKSESTQSKDPSFLTPKKGRAKESIVSSANVVEMLSPTPKKGKPIEKADELNTFIRLLAYINSRQEGLEDIQKELNKTIEEATVKRIRDLSVQIEGIENSENVLPILNQKVLSNFFIYPCKESGRIAHIILTRFPELESEFSERALMNWKNVTFYSGTPLENAIHKAMFEEVQSLVDAATSADDVRFVLKQYMLFSLKQREIKEIKRAADVILSKFPQLLEFFSKEVRKIYKEAALASRDESLVTPAKAASKEINVGAILSPQTKEGYVVMQVGEIDFSALFMWINSIEGSVAEIQKSVTSELDSTIGRMLRQLKGQIDAISSADKVLPILEKSYMTRLEICPLSEDLCAANIVISSFPSLAHLFSEAAQEKYQDVVFLDPKTAPEKINEQILDQLASVVDGGDESAVVTFLQENRFLAETVEVRQIQEINRAARIILEKFPGLLGNFSRQIQRDYASKKSASSRGESKEATGAEDASDSTLSENKRRVIASLPANPMEILKTRVIT